MSQQEAEELLQAQKLIDDGKFKEALQLVNDFGKKKDLSSHERISYYIFKSRLAEYFADNKECTKYAEKAYQESQNFENSLLLLDIYLQMVDSLIWNSKTKKASKFIKKCEDLLNILPQELSTVLTKRKGYLLWLKGIMFFERGEFEKALESAKQSLAIRQELGNNIDIAESLLQLCHFSWRFGNLNHALKYVKSCQTLAKKFNWVEIIYRCYSNLGVIYTLKGELDMALSYNEKVLKYAKKENNFFKISSMYNNIGMIYQEKGDFSRALENLEKSISIKENRGVNIEIFMVTDTLFQLALDMNDLDKAQRYLNRMKQITDQTESKLMHQAYNIDRAIYLKNSPRAFNRGKAEEILKQLIREGISRYELLQDALLNLCDLLLTELCATNDSEILTDLEGYISQLLDTVKNSRSYSLLAETYLLRARLALITMEIIKARKFLTKAQEIANRYGLDRLAIKISNEHDELLKKLEVWEKLKGSKAPISERMKLAQLNEQMERMIRRREIDVPKHTDEEPILLLIVSEGGTPFFSQFFIEDHSFKDHLFGGFLSAINSFMNEMFSEELDRASFGEYTLLMNSISPFMIFYIYKGLSYSAQHRLKLFNNELKRNKDIWKTIENYYQRNKEIQINDIPLLDSIINDIFIEKTITLDLKLNLA